MEKTVACGLPNDVLHAFNFEIHVTLFAWHNLARTSKNVVIASDHVYIISFLHSANDNMDYVVSLLPIATCHIYSQKEQYFVELIGNNTI